MYSIKTLASTFAAAGLVSVIGLAYAQTSAPPGSSTDRSIQSPSNQGNMTMPSDSTSTKGNTTMPNNSADTRGSTMSSDNNVRADGSSNLERRADRN